MSSGTLSFLRITLLAHSLRSVSTKLPAIAGPVLDWIAAAGPIARPSRGEVFRARARVELPAPAFA